MLMRTDPFRELDRVAQQMLGRTSTQLAVPMDAYRQGHAFIVKLDLPGVGNDAIDLEIERNVLTVRAERPAGHGENREILHAERPTGTFTRQLFLSDGLDTDNIRASYHDGVLTLEIPVAEQAKPRKVLVDSSDKPKQLEQ
jgi:HSP20 family protein